MAGSLVPFYRFINASAPEPVAVVDVNSTLAYIDNQSTSAQYIELSSDLKTHTKVISKKLKAYVDEKIEKMDKELQTYANAKLEKVDEKVKMPAGGAKPEKVVNPTVVTQRSAQKMNQKLDVGFIADELKTYKSLFDSGMITQEEFDIKKRELSVKSYG